MAINRSSIAKELLPGLNAVFGTAPTKNEGAAVTYDNASESYTARYSNETIALAFAITEEAMEDNLYDTFSKLRAKGLARAMANTKQQKAANIFNNAFNTGVNAIGDGAAFISTSHPVKIGGNQSNYANNGAAADLSQTTLETSLIQIQKTKDDRGILIGASAVSLHVPNDSIFIADVILNTPGVTGSADNDINSVRHMGLLPDGYYVNRRFNDGDAFFIKTDVPNGTKMFVRTPLQTKMEPDFDTGNIRFKARERYSFGVSDWRGFFGNAGT